MISTDGSRHALTCDDAGNDCPLPPVLLPVSGHDRAVLVTSAVVGLFCVIGAVLNGRVAVSGRFPRVGAYRHAPPPPQAARILYGVVAVILGICALLALRYLLVRP
jgi:hypothetical protein